MSDIVLVGLPGSGKTTTGRALARTLDVSFVDVDDLFFSREGVSVQDYLRAHGESDFRELELAALAEGLVGRGVVATGGGAVTTPAARTLLTTQLTVWLDCPVEKLAKRVVGGDRPLLGDDPPGRLAALRTERERFYAEASQHRVDSGRPLPEVLNQLLVILETSRALK